MQLTKTLSQTPVLWLTFIATLLLTFSFQIVTAMWGVTLIDPISNPDQARAVIAAMTAEQNTLHAWVTATLDVAYPAAYGALFIGSALKFFPRAGSWLVIPMLVLIPTDLLEGVVQVLALLDITDWLDAKAVLTPLKTILFLFGFGFTVIGWIIWCVHKVRGT